MSKKLTFSLFAIGASLITLSIYGVFDKDKKPIIESQQNQSKNNITTNTLKETAITQEAGIKPTEQDTKYDEGKRIASHLEENCDYWQVDHYNPDGTVSVSKGIYTEWGNKRAMLIPRQSWDSLSQSKRDSLTTYLEREGIQQIIVGEVQPSQVHNRNTITVDETVWESYN